MYLQIIDNRTKQLVRWSLCPNNLPFRIYICGPTLYRSTHFGNYRSLIIADSLCAYLKYYQQVYQIVSNITDIGTDEIDEKITQAAKAENISSSMLISNYYQQFINDLHYLDIDLDVFIPASCCIKEQITEIKNLIAQNHAYKQDHDIYMHSNIDKTQLIFSGTRVQDTCIWRNQTSSSDIINDPQLGPGIPGWHIECACIIWSNFDNTREYYLDLHMGGIDLADIHHNQELIHHFYRYNNYNLARCWMHINNVMVNGSKMSKSSNNTILIQDLKLSKLGIKILALYTQYNQTIDITPNYLEQIRDIEKSIIHHTCNLIFHKYQYTINEQAKYIDIINSIQNTIFMTNIELSFDTHLLISQIQTCKSLDIIIHIDKAIKLGLIEAIKQSILSSSAYYYLVRKYFYYKQCQDFSNSDKIRSSLFSEGIHILQAQNNLFVYKVKQ